MSAQTSPLPDDLETATFCAALVDEWVRHGATDAVVAPGSRNTPLTLAIAADQRLRTHVVLDERSAGFVALGLGLAGGRPAVVVTTSGTAAAELLPAVVEAHQARVPLIVCTADRPPELQHVGAPQTIDQTRLYGTAVRFFLDPGVAQRSQAGTWRSLASRVWLEATGVRPGPVQLNLPFREPLVGQPGPLPAGRADSQPWHRRLPSVSTPSSGTAEQLAADWAGRRGVVVAGAGVDNPTAVLELARGLGWPVLADPRSGCRRPDPVVVAHADALVRPVGLAERLRPEVVVRLGDPPASRVLGRWLADSGATAVVVDPAGAAGGVVDPERTAELVVSTGAGSLAQAVTAAMAGGRAGAPATAAGWLGDWRSADDAAGLALERWLADTPVANEPAVARSVAAIAAAEEGAVLVVSSSMPVRDLEWYGPALAELRVVANRGANGIDGVLSTATGVALHGPPTWLLIGDLALLHDSSALLGLAGRPVRLRLVVVDNAGGGIFSFLPQAAALAAERFERFYATPQAVDVGDLLAVHGIPVRTAARAQEVDAGLAELAAADTPVEALVVRTDRPTNVEHHEQLNATMGAAATAALGTD